MSIKLTLGAIEVTCETPNEAIVLAGAASQLKPPKDSELSKLVNRPIKLTLNGAELVCENPVAAAATLVTAGVITRQKMYTRESRGAQGAGPERAWKVAKAYGEKHGISTDEAKRLIAKKKREIRAKMQLGTNDAKDKAFMQEIQALGG